MKKRQNGSNDVESMKQNKKRSKREKWKSVPPDWKRASVSQSDLKVGPAATLPPGLVVDTAGRESHKEKKKQVNIEFANLPLSKLTFVLNYST